MANGVSVSSFVVEQNFHLQWNLVKEQWYRRMLSEYSRRIIICHRIGHSSSVAPGTMLIDINNYINNIARANAKSPATPSASKASDVASKEPSRRRLVPLVSSAKQFSRYLCYFLKPRTLNVFIVINVWTCIDRCEKFMEGTLVAPMGAAGRPPKNTVALEGEEAC